MAKKFVVWEISALGHACCANYVGILSASIILQTSISVQKTPRHSYRGAFSFFST
jgi:predicted MarR family transcription regulator